MRTSPGKAAASGGKRPWRPRAGSRPLGARNRRDLLTGRAALRAENRRLRREAGTIFHLWIVLGSETEITAPDQDGRGICRMAGRIARCRAGWTAPGRRTAGDGWS